MTALVDVRYEYAISEQVGGFLFKGDQHEVMDKVTDMLKKKLGFFVNIDVYCEDETEGYMFLYLHSDNEEDLTDEQLRKVISLGFGTGEQEEDAHMAICEYLNIFIEAI